MVSQSSTNAARCWLTATAFAEMLPASGARSAGSPRHPGGSEHRSACLNLTVELWHHVICERGLTEMVECYDEFCIAFTILSDEVVPVARNVSAWHDTLNFQYSAAK